MSTTVNTVTGPVSSDALGRTMMHEHVLIGWPGWESDTFRPGPARDEMIAVGSDNVASLQDHGITTMLDPCPNDLGRDVTLMAEIARRTGFQIICATGLYKEDQGGGAYWKFRESMGGSADMIAEMYIRELTEGIGDTGIKAGIIKLATGTPAITPYEKMLIEAAGKASIETGAPIITHTDEGSLGDQQQELLIKQGVPAKRIIIGHSCGTSDHDYHMKIVNGGSYIGFDRFGLEMLQPDDVRIASTLALFEAGAASRIVVSHDTVWCWRGEPIPSPEVFEELLARWTPTHFIERIIPKLKEGGASDEQIAMVLEENPRRFFAGEELPALG